MIEIEDIFNEGGLLASEIDGFEYRAEQKRMASFILEQLYDGGNGLVEAGTGTGKTLAYLFPAVLFALAEDRRIAVSTETKTLQKQLIEKELPLVKRLLERCGIHGLKFSLCLGGSNYPCRFRLEHAVLSGRMPPPEMKRLERIIARFDRREIFTSFDLELPPSLWQEICREGEVCNPTRCPFTTECPYLMARKEWGESNCLVMNHYLFFTNIASGKTHLPPFDVVIFDEAHSLEEIASSILGFSLSRGELAEIVDSFHADGGRGLFSAAGDKKFKKRAAALSREIKTEADRFFESLRGLLPAEKIHARLTEPPAGGTLLMSRVAEFLDITAEMGKDIAEDHSMHLEYAIQRGRIVEYAEHLKSFVFQEREHFVYWLEKETGAILGELYLKGQPIDVSDIINREVIEGYDSSIFVSATLSVNGNFSYLVNRLGIENYRAVSIPSSFDFERQVVVYAAEDIADPSHELYHRQASERAARIIQDLGGNCLMLFTSYRSLGEVRELLADLIDHPIYSQDTMPAAHAFDRYVADDCAVLMGTHTFWQGIDLPGDLLRGVIMMKLPFAVPDYPPVQAKMEKLQDAGMNPFYALQIPEAVLRFKQGFGRLIRSASDRGVVAVLDSRIVTKPYGRMFMNSIPRCQVVRTIDALKEAYCNLCSA